MSSDNGVYILVTGDKKPKEYRVAHLQAVENYLHDENIPYPDYCKNHNCYCQEHNPEECPMCIAYNKKFNSPDPDVHIRNARKMWANSLVYKTEGKAVHKAMELYRECYICEYGIQTIEIPRDF